MLFIYILSFLFLSQFVATHINSESEIINREINRILLKAEKKNEKKKADSMEFIWNDYSPANQEKNTKHLRHKKQKPYPFIRIQHSANPTLKLYDIIPELNPYYTSPTMFSLITDDAKETATRSLPPKQSTSQFSKLTFVDQPKKVETRADDKKTTAMKLSQTTMRNYWDTSNVIKIPNDQGVYGKNIPSGSHEQHFSKSIFKSPKISNISTSDHLTPDKELGQKPFSLDNTAVKSKINDQNINRNYADKESTSIKSSTKSYTVFSYGQFNNAAKKITENQWKSLKEAEDTVHSTPNYDGSPAAISKSTEKPVKQKNVKSTTASFFGKIFENNYTTTQKQSIATAKSADTASINTEDIEKLMRKKTKTNKLNKSSTNSIKGNINGQTKKTTKRVEKAATKNNGRLVIFTRDKSKVSNRKPLSLHDKRMTDDNKHTFMMTDTTYKKAATVVEATFQQDESILNFKQHTCKVSTDTRRESDIQLSTETSTVKDQDKNQFWKEISSMNNHDKNQLSKEITSVKNDENNHLWKEIFPSKTYDDTQLWKEKTSKKSKYEMKLWGKTTPMEKYNKVKSWKEITSINNHDEIHLPKEKSFMKNHNDIQLWNERTTQNHNEIQSWKKTTPMEHHDEIHLPNEIPSVKNYDSTVMTLDFSENNQITKPTSETTTDASTDLFLFMKPKDKSLKTDNILENMTTDRNMHTTAKYNYAELLRGLEVDTTSEHSKISEKVISNEFMDILSSSATSSVLRLHDDKNMDIVLKEINEFPYESPNSDTILKSNISNLYKDILGNIDNVELMRDESRNMKQTTDVPERFHEKIRKHFNWDRVVKFFGHDRVCNCKCKANKTMCKICAASDVVMRELAFEFNSLAEFMNNHCTEIQTFFWMNPTGGKKLRDTVHNIDKTLQDYYKRVKGKCNGRTCKTFATYLDRKRYLKQRRKYIKELLLDLDDT